MGYTEGTSPKGGPDFNNSPQTTADFQRLRDYIEQQGNTRTGMAAEMNGIVPPEAYDGLVFRATDVKRSYIYLGGWLLLSNDASPHAFAEAAGSVAVGASGLTTVTFPTGRFNVAPIVTYSIVASGGNVSQAWVSVVPTATGFTIRAYTQGGTQIAATVHWHAKQMTPTTAAG